MGPGLDHGVFVPFRIMFGEDFTEIPIVQVSIDSSLDPKKNWELGKALASLRYENPRVIGHLGTQYGSQGRRNFDTIGGPDSAQP
jgi:4,5-DOPA dioxygenase extradiol